MPAAGQTGTNSAAAVVMQMKSTFRAIRFGLMVGIGGGVPSAEADIRLGDIVISQPGYTHGGIVQYDFGRSTPSGIERTGFLNPPPRILLNAISKLRANHDLGKSDLLVHGLLAMMLLHDSRREARFSDGELVLLGDQDRSRWNTEQVAAGRAQLDRAVALRGRGPYALQAAIASLHAEVPCDWAQIAALYGELARLTGSPVVELNRAIAIAQTEGPEAGLRMVNQLGLDDFRYLHSTRAELLRRLGRTDEARDAYRRARQLTDDGPERRFLERRLTELAATPGSG